MNYLFSPIAPEDRIPVVDIFNYYVENSFAGSPEVALPYELFDLFMNISKGYPTATVKTESGLVIGFGMLQAFNPVPTFSHTADVSYFIAPDWTGQGIGTALLNLLETSGHQRGIESLIAVVSSLNTESILFHIKNGFEECGRIKKAGFKKGMFFDVVYFQKILNP